MIDCKYQEGYSQIYHAHNEKSEYLKMYDIDNRRMKAGKILSVLDDYYSGELDGLSVLEIGCSTGIMSNLFAKMFDRIKGIDIDNEAVFYAKKHQVSPNLEFYVQDAMNISYPENSFDVVICNHIYEHVPDSKVLFREIHRVLKPEGICYLAAGNRLILIEEHYMLPLLSVMPKVLAHLYLRILGRGKFYYENHLTVWGLRRRVSKFRIIDYTLKIIKEPQRFNATEMVRDNSFRQKIAGLIAKRFYWLFPTYIWLLKK